jgi:hypothetical protein
VGITDTDGQTLLTLDEAKDFLQVSRATIYRLVSKGILEKRKFPKDRQTYVPLQSLESYRESLGMTTEEMAIRIVRLEKELNFLKHQAPRVTSAVKPTKSGSGASIDSVMRTLRKHHPDQFS